MLTITYELLQNCFYEFVHLKFKHDYVDVSLSELRELVMDREAWRAAIHGVTKSRTRLSDWSDLIWCGYPLQYSWASLVAQLVKNPPAMWDTWVGKIPWRKERLPIPVFWPREFHGLYSPWSCKELLRLSNFHIWVSLPPSLLFMIYFLLPSVKNIYSIFFYHHMNTIQGV